MNPPMNVICRRREVLRVRVIAGPRAGTVREIRRSDFPPRGYVRGAIARLFDVRYDLEEEDQVATLYDDDEYEGHRRSSKRARISEATLPEVTAGRSREGEDCAVCLQAFRADETLRAMPCAHAFHQHCISEWLRRSAVCPLCRHQLPPADEEEDADADEQIAS